jgi:hypothetical protein
MLFRPTYCRKRPSTTPRSRRCAAARLVGLVRGVRHRTPVGEHAEEVSAAASDTWRKSKCSPPMTSNVSRQPTSWPTDGFVATGGCPGTTSSRAYHATWLRPRLIGGVSANLTQPRAGITGWPVRRGRRGAGDADSDLVRKPRSRVIALVILAPSRRSATRLVRLDLGDWCGVVPDGVGPTRT